MVLSFSELNNKQKYKFNYPAQKCKRPPQILEKDLTLTQRSMRQQNSLLNQCPK